MANYFSLTLDTTGPSNPSIRLNSNAQFATNELVTATIGTGDSVTSGYQMKIWGDIDVSWAKSNGLVGSSATTVSEATASWISYATSKQLKLSSGDGSKTVNLQLRDDVYNVSALASDSINLDTSRPIVTITGPDVSKISKQDGKNVAAFSFTVDSAFVEYKVKVTTSGADHSTGTQIGSANGSTNMSATGSFAKGSVINSTINGADLEAASAGDGTKVIKVVVRDEAGNWSI